MYTTLLTTLDRWDTLLAGTHWVSAAWRASSWWWRGASAGGWRWWSCPPPWHSYCPQHEAGVSSDKYLDIYISTSCPPASPPLHLRPGVPAPAHWPLQAADWWDGTTLTAALQTWGPGLVFYQSSADITLGGWWQILSRWLAEECHKQQTNWDVPNSYIWTTDYIY